MKKLLLLLPLSLAILCLVLAFFWWKTAISAPSNNDTEQTFLITKGSSADTIGKNLKEAGLIRSAFAFKLYLQTKGLTTKIPPGNFVLPKNLTVSELTNLLLEGPTEFWVTVPEGLRREEIPDKFISSLNMSSADAQAFRTQFLAQSAEMEGYLFPDTYLVPPDITADKVVSLMRNTFNTRFSDPHEAEIAQSELSLNEIVILASLLERETLTKEERPVVAGILLNRLNNDWPLQVDATIQYAVGKSGNWWPRPVTRDQYDLDSPFNTYKYAGIPPAPIANPGLTSLEAMLEPSETDYFFYIHADGKIYYAKTLQEHNSNVQKYLR